MISTVMFSGGAASYIAAKRWRVYGSASGLQDDRPHGDAPTWRMEEEVNFDVKSYCERMAKARPERFECMVEYLPLCVCRDIVAGLVLWSNDNSRGGWGFIGPLADELGITAVTTARSGTRNLLEATFAAVCMVLEAKNGRK